MTKNYEMTQGIATVCKGNEENPHLLRGAGVEADISSLLDLLRRSVNSSARRPLSSNLPRSGRKQKARIARRSSPRGEPNRRVLSLPQVVIDGIDDARIGVRHDDLYLARMFLVPGRKARVCCRDIIDLLDGEERGWNAIIVLAHDGEIELVGSFPLSQNTWILRCS